MAPETAKSGSERSWPIAGRGIFLATKIATRDYDEAIRRTETSLRRLQTDQIDLIHIRPLRGSDNLTAIEAGSLKALMRLRDEKVCRIAGITSHSHPDVPATALSRHDFDCTRMALDAALQGRSENSRDPVEHAGQDSFGTVALPVAVQKGMGVLAMKVTGQEVFRHSHTDALRALLARHVSGDRDAHARIPAGECRGCGGFRADAARRTAGLSDGLIPENKVAMERPFHRHLDA